MVASSVVPDMDTFCGHGAKNQIPMWRDKLATTPNLAVGLTGVLAAAHGTGSPPTEDVVAYVFGLLGTGAYTALFADELGTSAPRVPFTSDRELFAEVVALGRDLLWWATFGERFQPLDGRGRQVTRLPPGTAKNAKAVPATPKGYPESFSYDESTKTIRVGEGEFGPVAPEVWEFDVSGLKVVQSWLAYRMKKRSGKSSSELDTIRPAAWSFSAEFVELLAVIEHFVSATAQAAVLLERVVGGALIDPALFPEPSDEERKSPGRASADDVLTLDLT